MNVNQSNVSQSSFQNLDQKSKTNAKPVSLDERYKYAPKQEENSWEILLKPKIEADRVRCGAWKEEVQNLLIFAGLFSSVVTSFVINSYQTLQAGPNDVIIGLLFHIANGLNTSSPFPPSVKPAEILAPFSQSSSSIRINVFWFLSLIFSLTTVLIGIISLQWIREHQSYPGCSAKEKLAILHMRTTALKAWHVPQIFSALPLMLQTALILFLAGLIDFSFFLGRVLIIVISVAVGLTLVLLTTTIVCPAVQELSFFTRRFNNKVPTPCPYKSPQSDVFRAMLELLSRLYFFVRPSRACRTDPDNYTIINPLSGARRHLAPYIYKLLQEKAGPRFDRHWLSLRDACHQHILDDGPNLYEHRQEWPEWDENPQIFPLSDITQCVMQSMNDTSGTRYTEQYITAVYYCFEELSSSIWNASRKPTIQDNLRKDRRSNYFEKLQKYEEGTLSLCNFLVHDGTYKYALSKASHPYIAQYSPLFHRDQQYLFLDMLLQKHPSTAFARYQLELLSRIMQFLFDNHVVGASPVPYKPNSIDPSLFGMSIIYIEYSPTSASIHPAQKFSFATDILSAVFKSAGSHDRLPDQLANSLCNCHISKLIFRLAVLTVNYLQLADKSAETLDLHSIGDRYNAIFKSVSDHLLAEVPSSNLETKRPCLLFYISSLYAWHWFRDIPDLNSLRRQRNFTLGLQSLLNAIQIYRKRICGRMNNVIEERLQPVDEQHEWDTEKATIQPSLPFFTATWWDRLSRDSANIINLSIPEAQPAASSSIPVDLNFVVTSESQGCAAPSTDPSRWPLSQPIPLKNVSISLSPPSSGSRTPKSGAVISNIRIDLSDENVEDRLRRAMYQRESSSNRSTPSAVDSRTYADAEERSAAGFPSRSMNPAALPNNQIRSSPSPLQLQSFAPDTSSLNDGAPGSANLHPSLISLLSSRSTAVQQEHTDDEGIQPRDNSSLDLGAAIPSIVISTTPITSGVDCPVQDDKEQGDLIIDIQPPRQ